MPKQVKIKTIRVTHKTQPVEIGCRDAVIDYVKSKRPHLKMKKLGEGAYATVIGSPSGKTVFKIGAEGDDGPYDHVSSDAYLDYLKLVCKNQDNPFYPKIKSATVYHRRDDQYAYIVEMERLTSLEDGKNYRKLRGPSKRLFNLLQDDDNFDSLATSADLILGLAPELKRNKKVNHFLSMVNDLGDLISEWGSDLHDGNIMLRGTQLVITDPIA